MQSSRQEDINLSLDLLHKRVWQHDCHHSLISRETKTIAYFSCASSAPSLSRSIICWQHLLGHRSVSHRTVSAQTSKVVRKQLKKREKSGIVGSSKRSFFTTKPPPAWGIVWSIICVVTGVLSSVSQTTFSSRFPTPHVRIPFLSPPQLMERGGAAWDGPSCGARAFLSQSVAAVLYGETEADSHHTSFSHFQHTSFSHFQVVLEDGTFNFQLLSAPVPPPQDVGQEPGIYTDAAIYLRHIAKACSHFFSSPMACEKRACRS